MEIAWSLLQTKVQTNVRIFVVILGHGNPFIATEKMIDCPAYFTVSYL